MQIDKGEAGAIALALEFIDSILIIDDYKSRRVAEKLPAGRHTYYCFIFW